MTSAVAALERLAATGHATVVLTPKGRRYVSRRPYPASE